MGPETLSSGKLELLSPKNLHYGSNFARMILPDEFEYTQTDYLAASQAIAILESRAGKVPEHDRNKQRIKKDAPFFLAVGLGKGILALSTECARCHDLQADR